MKKSICTMAAVIAAAGVFTACGDSLDTDVGTPGSPDGKWELVKAEDEGEVIDAKKEKWVEKFEIDGSKGTLAIKYKELDEKYDITVEKLSDEEYDIKMRGMISLGTAKFGEKKMVYKQGKDKNVSTLVFEKK